MDLDILKTLTETGNPFVNILAIVGLSVVIFGINLFIKTIGKVNNHEIEITHLKETIKEMKEDHSKLETEHRGYTRKKGGH